MKSVLKVYIAENCSGCDEARRIAAHIEQDCPEIEVEVIDIIDSQAVVPEVVFATPTFILDDCIVSLGNPSPEQVAQWMDEVIAIQPEP